MVSFLALFLGFWVYLINKKSKTNQAFFWLAFFIFLWIIISFWGNISTDPEFATFLGRLAYGAAALMLIAFYYFPILFLGEERRYHFLSIVVVTTSLILLFVSVFTELMVVGMDFTKFGAIPILGNAKFIYLPVFIFVMLFVLRIFLVNYIRSSEKLKLQIQYFLLGFFIWILANLIFGAILPIFQVTPQFWAVGNYSVIFLLGFTALAIIKRGLFGIKVILTSFLVGAIAILLLLDLIIFTEELWLRVAKSWTLAIFLFFGWLLIKSVLREIKQREALAEAYVKLQQLDKAKTEFLSIASHQLRTPLTAVKGYISMLLEKTYGAVPEKMIKPLRSIYSSNERLIKLVNDLLNVSRIEAGRTEKSLEKTPLQELVQNIVEELKLIANAKNLYLKFEEPEKPLPEIFLDKDKIRQVVMNIIDNAIKYTERGGVTVKIREKDKNIQISISDTGDGLSQEEVDHLFTSFTRGKAGTRLWVEGAGLGLYIAKKFIDMHNGKIWAESQGRGQGSVFYIELPIELSE